MNGVRYARTAGVHVGAGRAGKVKNRLVVFFVGSVFPSRPKPAFTMSRKRNTKLFRICSRDGTQSEAEDGGFTVK